MNSENKPDGSASTTAKLDASDKNKGFWGSCPVNPESKRNLITNKEQQEANEDFYELASPTVLNNSFDDKEEKPDKLRDEDDLRNLTMTLHQSQKHKSSKMPTLETNLFANDSKFLDPDKSLNLNISERDEILSQSESDKNQYAIPNISNFSNPLSGQAADRVYQPVLATPEKLTVYKLFEDLPVIIEGPEFK